MGSTLTSLIHHIVFSTKSRKNNITPEIRDDLYRYMGGIIKGEGAVFMEIGGTSNHVHLVIKIRPVHALSDIIRKIKGNSSRWINQQKRLTTRFWWQEGFGAFSVSESQLPVLIRYVKGQEKHHRNLSFKEELIKLLELHRVEYDERYLWD